MTYVIIKSDGTRTYIDYHYNERFKSLEDAKNCLNLMFQELKEKNRNPEWVEKLMFRYTFDNRRIYARIGEVK